MCMVNIFVFVYLIGFRVLAVYKKTPFFLNVYILYNSQRSLFSLQDFVMGLSILLRGTIQEKLNWAFNLYDINKDGYITKEVCPNSESLNNLNIHLLFEVDFKAMVIC